MADLAHNRKAHFDYALLDTYEAGIELAGSEVKSIRAGRCALEGGHIIARGGEVFVVGIKIDPYQAGNTAEDYDPTRTRKLLLNKNEIRELAKAETTKGLTIIPLALYSKGPKLKIKIAIAKGKKLFDKRETIKQRDLDRELGRDNKVR